MRTDHLAIGKYPCDTSIPNDTPRTFIWSLFLLFRDRYRGDLTLCQEVHGRPVGGAIWRTLWQISWPSSTIDLEFDRPIIYPRGTYWGWIFQHLQPGRRHLPCQESGAGVWWWYGTSTQKCYFGQPSCCWHTVWETEMGMGWHWLLWCGITES